MGVHLGGGGGKGEGGISGVRRVHSEKAEHDHTVHRYAIAYVTV